MMKKPWKNTYKMHDACSLKSKLSCNHSWFILFFKRRNSAKKWKQKYNNPSFNLNTWIQVKTMKSWISEDCSTKNPKIQKSIFSNRIFGFRSKRWIFGFPKVFFGFFWILRKGVWIFGFPSQKSKKTQGKRWNFQKK